MALYKFLYYYYYASALQFVIVLYSTCRMTVKHWTGLGVLVESRLSITLYFIVISTECAAFVWLHLTIFLCNHKTCNRMDFVSLIKGKLPRILCDI